MYRNKYLENRNYVGLRKQHWQVFLQYYDFSIHEELTKFNVQGMSFLLSGI